MIKNTLAHNKTLWSEEGAYILSCSCGVKQGGSTFGDAWRRAESEFDYPTSSLILGFKKLGMMEQAFIVLLAAEIKFNCRLTK